MSFSVDGDPPVQFFVMDGGQGLGIRVPLAPREEAPHGLPSEIGFRAVVLRGEHRGEVFTENESLFGVFFQFAMSLADGLQSGGGQLSDVLPGRLAEWRSLLRTASTLSDEQQVGLWGELWLLARLLAVRGDDAIEAWVGPRREAHDFRLGNNEIEVKTTTAERRVHVISGLSQLVPSSGKRLHILSLQIAEGGPGTGLTLAQAVDRVERGLKMSARRTKLWELLETGFSLDPHTLEQLRRTYMLRSLPELVRVDRKLPVLTTETLRRARSPYPERITDVRYRLDLTGLGVPDGTDSFCAVIPEARSR